jgi:hypothetical protein
MIVLRTGPDTRRDKELEYKGISVNEFYLWDVADATLTRKRKRPLL